MSLTEGRRLTPRIQTLIARTPEVTEVLTQLGRPEDGTDPKLQNNLEVFIKLRPLASWRHDKRTLGDLVSEMDLNLKELPGVEYNFSQPIRDNVNENISGQFGQIAVKIYGEDLDQLQGLAAQAQSAIAGVPGVADLGTVKAAATPSISVRLDRDALARYDLDMADVQDYVETALGGHVATQLWEGEKKFDVVVRLPPGKPRRPVGDPRAACRSRTAPSFPFRRSPRCRWTWVGEWSPARTGAATPASGSTCAAATSGRSSPRRWPRSRLPSSSPSGTR